MNIKQLLAKCYPKLLKLCTKNIISSVRNTTGLNDFEEIDLLNSMVVNWIEKKYKDVEFDDLEKGFQKLKSELLAEKNYYQKLDKPNQIRIVELKLKDDINYNE